MRMRWWGVCLLVAAFGLRAQAQEMPKPGPEQAKIKYFIGDWKTEGDMKPSPYAPGGHFSSNDHAVAVGDFYVAIHSDGTMPGAGSITTLAVMGYDAKQSKYTYDEFSSLGMHEQSLGTVSGDTWTWTTTEEMGGKTVQGRFTMTIVSPTSYTFKYEMSPDGTKWTQILEGKSTKV